MFENYENFFLVEEIEREKSGKCFKKIVLHLSFNFCHVCSHLCYNTSAFHSRISVVPL